MKTLALILAYLALAVSPETPQMQFDYLELDYGKIQVGSDGRRHFPFTNTGDVPLMISHMTSSCGCLVPYYPREPIMPGERSQVSGLYDTKRIGIFTKYLTVSYYDHNTESDVVVRLKIYGEVLPKQNPDQD